jgi:hypothetical protein
MISGMTPSDLVTTIMSHASGKQDLVVPAKDINFSRNEFGQIRLNAGTHDLAMTSHANAQMTGFLGIPRRFASRLETQFPDLLVHNFNTMLQKAEGRRMVRTLDGNARAIMSDSYRRIDNELVFDGMYPVLDRLGAKIESANVSDDYMNIQATIRIEGEIRKGDVVRYGVSIRNSEIGKGALSVSPLLYRLVCTNGMVVADQQRRRAHIGGSYLNAEDGWIALSSATQMLKTRAMIAELAEYLEAMASPEMFEKTLNSLRDVADQALPAEPTLVVESLAARYGMNKPESESALIALAESKDYSRWGLANAVTVLANSASNYDRAMDLEVLGGRVMQMNAREYNDLSRMPKASEVVDEEELVGA